MVTTTRAIKGLLAASLTSLLLSSGAQAANWFKLRGTEPGGTSHTLQVWGFLQPTFAKDYSDEIEGGIGGFARNNGTLPVPGTLPPDRTEQKSFYMRRARLGVRGTMIPVSNDIDYFFLTEWGQNGVTRNSGTAKLLDASVTFNQLSRGIDDNGLANLGARIRVGQFLFSQTSQALSQSTPGRRVHIWMPEATLAHALGLYVSDNGVGNFPEDQAGVNGARDVGVEIFDWVEFENSWFGGGGPLEFTYSFALGNGNRIGELDNDGNFRRYAWLSLAKLFDETRGPRRHDVEIYGFYQKGDILFNNDLNNDGRPDGTPIPAGGNVNPGNLNNGFTPTGVEFGIPSNGTRVTKNGNEQDYEQKYWGYGFEYFDKPFAKLGQIRLEAEWQKQDGLTFDGPQSPSAGTNDNDTGGFESVLYETDGENTGWYVDFGYDIQGHLRSLGIPAKRTTLNVRYDRFNRNEGNDVREVNFNTWTATAEYFFHKKARATLTYQWRDWSANKRSDPPFKTNGNAALDPVDQRIGLQVTFIFKNVLLR